ncbi:hypothetical protein BXZ70DRAFT_690189 [Cristinia sonorae]|uniref:F-box domain-containing protein n=1 Tax=Cristinia sonorae TaxID=1940300 RepID=A0A8K0UFT7_9AGAR|nr:hypothetical protein BXZ70DRAFT_690189 [Cristinia sonorae]
MAPTLRPRRVVENTSAAPRGRRTAPQIESTTTNAAPPIHRIPAEILSEIFQYCQHEPLELQLVNGKPSKVSTFSQGWIREVTHVCQQWRQVALNTPSLWSNICITEGNRNPDSVRVRIARSKNLPLDLHVSTWDPHIVSISLDVLSRVRTLALGLPYVMHQLIFLPPSAPLLTSLGITVLIDLSGARTPPITEQAFFERCATPNLKQLALYYYSINWSQVMFPPTLTHLTIAHVVRSTLTVAIPRTVHILTALPLLKFLRLENTFSANDVFNRAADPASPLPHLEYVFLSGNTYPCLHFLSQVTYPLSAKVYLKSHDIEVLLILRSLVSPMQSVLGMSGRVVDGIAISPTQISFHTQDPAATASEPLEPETQLIPALEIPGSQCFFTWDISPVSFDEEFHFDRLISRLPLQGVSYFHVVGGVYKKERRDYWIQLLRVMPNIKTFAFRSGGAGGDTVPAVPGILALLNHLDEGASLMPQLRNIELDGILLRRSRKVNPVKELSAVLDSRRGVEGGAVEKVVLQKCVGVHRGDVELLRRSVEVEWDGFQL